MLYTSTTACSNMFMLRVRSNRYNRDVCYLYKTENILAEIITKLIVFSLNVLTSLRVIAIKISVIHISFISPQVFRRLDDDLLCNAIQLETI